MPVSYKLLYIEDDIYISDLYKLVFQQKGVSMDVSYFGKDGLKKAEEFTYSGIMLDFMLPDMDGIEILKALKASDKTKNIPVVFCSNMGQDSVTNEAMKLGAVAYIVKASYTPSEIYDEVMANIKKNMGASV